MLFLNFAVDGVPFIYNGNEIADCAPHNIFANREFGRLFIDWSKALTREGKARMGLVRKLVSMKRELPALYRGKTVWLKNSAPDRAVSFARIDGVSGQRLFCVANAKPEPAEFSAAFDAPEGFEEKLSSGAEWEFSGGKLRARLAPYGYAMLEARE